MQVITAISGKFYGVNRVNSVGINRPSANFCNGKSNGTFFQVIPFIVLPLPTSASSKLLSTLVSSQSARSFTPFTGEEVVRVLAEARRDLSIRLLAVTTPAIKIPIIRITAETSRREKALYCFRKVTINFLIKKIKNYKIKFFFLELMPAENHFF